MPNLGQFIQDRMILLAYFGVSASLLGDLGGKIVWKLSLVRQ